MADIRSVLGKFNGTMGGITFTQWKGKNVAKQKVPDTNSSATEAQVRQRNSFGLLARLGGQLRRQVAFGFAAYATRMTEQNAFNSQNKGAIKLDADDNPYIDYTLIQVANGQLAPSAGVTAKYDPATGQFTVTFTNNSGAGGAQPGDFIRVSVVQKSTNTALVDGGSLGNRNQPVPNTFQFAKGLDPADIAVYTFAIRFPSGEVSTTLFTQAVHV